MKSECVVSMHIASYFDSDKPMTKIVFGSFSQKFSTAKNLDYTVAICRYQSLYGNIAEIRVHFNSRPIASLYHESF